MPPSTPFQNAMLLGTRVITAAIFFYAGYAKIPLWSTDAATAQMAPWLFHLMLFLTVSEPIGAAAILVGFLTRTAAWCLAIIMIGAIFVTQFMMGVGFATATGAGWNFPLAILGALLPLMAFGPGQWSLQGMWHRALNRPIA
jgi:uncharacterized membrane protein YphA (DoxX/SURF4 family)